LTEQVFYVEQSEARSNRPSIYQKAPPNKRPPNANMSKSMREALKGEGGTSLSSLPFPRSSTSRTLAFTYLCQLFCTAVW